MVCQNQSIDDSEAPLAHDLRVLVRERLKAGDSDAQVLDFLVARYGEFVLLRPRLSWHNAAALGRCRPPFCIDRHLRLLLCQAAPARPPAPGGRKSDAQRKKPGCRNCCGGKAKAASILRRSRAVA